MKLAIVVQRYGAEVSGGAERHARYIAEHLSRHADVRVLTTCARDYVTWRNAYPPGRDVVNGIAVERFPVARERDAHEFGVHSGRVFRARHSLQDELRWLDVEGPYCPALVERVRAGQDVDFFFFFSARYYQTFHGARAVPERAILVPTAERDPTLGLAMFVPLFRGVRAIMYNSFEERAVIQAASANHDVPGVVVGVGSEIPDHVDAARFRAKFGIDSAFVLYVGRIDENKGCAELFDYFCRYLDTSGRDLRLVLIGTAVIEVPSHPAIRHLGHVSDADKFDALAAATALMMPSRYESLSMVMLEAWALGRPVLANARCEVLLGQCLRSNGGLYYEDSVEFAAALDRLLADPALADALGRSGRAYYRRHYDWPVIERKYLEMLDTLHSNPAPRSAGVTLPGWLDRRRRNLPPAAAVVDGLPSGPVR